MERRRTFIEASDLRKQLLGLAEDIDAEAEYRNRGRLDLRQGVRAEHAHLNCCRT
jgi:hypothetical protein